MTAIRLLQYTDWAEFKRDLFVELFPAGRYRPGKYLFRGSGDADWSLSALFDRTFAQMPADRRMELWDQLVTEWRAGCADLGVPSAILDDEHRLTALGQHHGLPTRLLDWSTSPYVAAFFAFHDHLLRVGTEFGHVAIWVLHLDNPVWSESDGVEIVAAPAMENVRLRNQSGKFTLSRAPHATLEEYVATRATSTALTKAVLPSTEAEDALSDLDSMGINHYQMFPDLTGLAALATTRAALTATLAEAEAGPWRER